MAAGWVGSGTNKTLRVVCPMSGECAYSVYSVSSYLKHTQLVRVYFTRRLLGQAYPMNANLKTVMTLRRPSLCKRATAASEVPVYLMPGCAAVLELVYHDYPRILTSSSHEEPVSPRLYFCLNAHSRASWR